MAASSSRGADQPAEQDRGTPAAAHARGASQPASFTVVSFNFGFEQKMMTGKNFKTHCLNFGRVCAKIVQDADADLLFACEVGGFRKGLSRAAIDAKDILTKPFGDSVGFCEVDNYLSLWGFGGAPQPADVSLREDTYIYHVQTGRNIDAVISRFDVHIPGHDTVHVVVGNMHIVCGSSPPSIHTRQRAVRLLRLHLDGIAALLSTGEPDTRVVRLIVGDDNLTAEEACEAFQRHTDDEALWEVFASVAERKGDHVAVCGAVARFKPIAVGASYRDRGLRNDAHDAVAVVLTLSSASQPGGPKRRKIGGGDLSDANAGSDTEVEGESANWGRSPSPSPVLPPLSPTSPADAAACDEAEDEVRRRARDLHKELREYWDKRYDAAYDPKLLHHLSLLLFKKRTSTQPADKDPAGAPQPGSDSDTAFASQAETARAIVCVLKVRHAFLQSKNIDDTRHVLTEAERGELVRRARAEYEQSEQQLKLQERDREKGKAKGKSSPQDPLGAPQPARKGRGGKGPRGASEPKGKGSRGASQPAGPGGQPQGAGLGSLTNFIRQQKRKRWCRHLQRVCGTKQIWEVLAFSGRFDVDMLTQALHAELTDDPLQICRDRPGHEEVSKEERRRLHHAKAEAIARYNEGERLARHRDRVFHGGAPQPADQGQEAATLTRKQMDVLRKWDTGELRVNRNNAIVAVGHGRLLTAAGDYMDIGGSTGGGSRRIIDSWQPPDWRDFLQAERES